MKDILTAPFVEEIKKPLRICIAWDGTSATAAT